MRSWCVLFAMAASALAGPVPIRAGLARIDITPAAGHEMGGYSARKFASTGTHDPLYATVLVIESACDLRSFVSTRVGEIARQKFGIKNTIISVSHTHSGPLTWEKRTPWYAEAEDKMVAAIGQAQTGMFDAAMSVSSGRTYLGFNRRKVADGRATMWWRNADKLPSHPLDPTFFVVEVRDTVATRGVATAGSVVSVRTGRGAGKEGAPKRGGAVRDWRGETAAKMEALISSARR